MESDRQFILSSHENCGHQRKKAGFLYGREGQGQSLRQHSQKIHIIGVFLFLDPVFCFDAGCNTANSVCNEDTDTCDCNAGFTGATCDGEISYICRFVLN